MTAGFLRVVVDGEERARINSENQISANLTLDEAAEVIEIYGAGDTLLATHLLSFAELRKGNLKQIFELENGKKIALDLAPVFDDYGEVAEINFSVGFDENRKEFFALPIFGKAKNVFSNLFTQPFLKPALSFGLIILALLFGWFVFRNLPTEKEQIVQNPPTENQNIQIKTPESLPKKDENDAEQKNDLSAPKDLKTPNAVLPKQEEKAVEENERKPKQEIKKQTVPKKEPVVETPKKELLAVDKNKRRREEPESDKDRILRLPIRETNVKIPGNNRDDVRSDKKFRGKPLNEIKTIYIEITGDDILGKQIAERMTSEINSFGRFEIVADKEKADAALKIYVRHESDVDEPEEKMVTGIVRLVNSEGFVVYPNRRGVSGWKYVGEFGKLPNRIAGDLNAAK
jgi:hypothetical protein